MVARTSWPPSSLTRNIVLGRASVTSPSTSIFSSLLAILPSFTGTGRGRRTPAAGRGARLPRPLPEPRAKSRLSPQRSSSYQDPRRSREHPRPLRGDRDRVLEVSRERAVDGGDRPAVVMDVHVRAAGGDHRLDRERHPRHEAGPGVPHDEVRHLRVLVVVAADAVADEAPDDREARLLDRLLDRRRDVADVRVDLRRLDPRLERRPADVEETLRLLRDLADPEGRGRVGDQPVLRDADVEGDDVALLRPVLAGDAVDDHVVRGDADRGRVALVALRGRHAAVVVDVLLGDPVELGHRDPRLEPLLEQRERARDHGPGRRHPLDLARALADDHGRTVLAGRSPGPPPGTRPTPPPDRVMPPRPRAAGAPAAPRPTPRRSSAPRAAGRGARRRGSARPPARSARGRWRAGARSPRAGRPGATAGRACRSRSAPSRAPRPPARPLAAAAPAAAEAGPAAGRTPRSSTRMRPSRRMRASRASAGRLGSSRARS